MHVPCNHTIRAAGLECFVFLVSYGRKLTAPGVWEGAALQGTFYVDSNEFFEKQILQKQL